MVADSPSSELSFTPGPDRLSMTREQLIAQIQGFNPTASAPYLRGFAVPDLQHYLDRLVIADEPRGPLARFVRRNDEPPIESFPHSRSA